MYTLNSSESAATESSLLHSLELPGNLSEMIVESNTRSSILLLIAATLSLTLFGCSSEPEEAENPTESPEMITREAPQRKPAQRALDNGDKEELRSTEQGRYRFIPKADGELAEDGNGLEIIINGSSEQAFADSLRWIAADTSKAQYARLEQSIRFINAYD
ncbi:MAG: hypothetical protein RQ741_04085, partial [Wenzhouxiangellaceae bacterium]|nr:hypothetical protein [Wenzhouxiangellaceae bacterium]